MAALPADLVDLGRHIAAAERHLRRYVDGGDVPLPSLEFLRALDVLKAVYRWRWRQYFPTAQRSPS